MLRATLFTGLFVTWAAVIAPSFGDDNSMDSFRQVTPRLAVAMASHQDDSDPLLEISDQFHGIARPSQLAELPSLVPGTITEMHVREGQFVSKGTSLVTLDDRVPRARLAVATIEAQLTGALRRAEVDQKLAESRLNRLRIALSQGAGAAFELQEAEGNRDRAVAAVEQQQDVLKAAEANRQLAEAQLSQYTIVAPFDGIVTQIHRKSGPIDPSQVIVTVANLNSLEVEMHLPSRMVGSIRQGQNISLKAGVPVSNVINGSVLSVSPIIESASNTFRCLLLIDNSQYRLPAGFSVVLNNPSSTDSRVSQVTRDR